MIKVNDLSSRQYSVNKNIRFKTSILRSGLCDYSDASIVVKETLTVEREKDDKTRNKTPMFKNNDPIDHAYQKSITHI